MTKMKRLTACLLTLSMLLLAAGCGASQKAYSVKERFELGDDQYALEKWERMSDLDTDSTNGYGICLLIVGQEAPVIMSMGGGQTTSGIDLTLTGDQEEPITAQDIQFAAVENMGDYGVRATFQFSLPKDKELPQQGTLINNSNKEETVSLDLSDLPGQES